MPDIEIPESFRRRLQRKTPQLQGAILECVQRLGDDPRHSGLRTHRVQGAVGVWEARVDRGNRLTFHWEGEKIVLRNHCNYDILTRNP